MASVANGQQAVALATKWMGTPYCWGGGHGGSVPIGTCVDCSGLVDQVFGITGNTYTQVYRGSSVADLNSAGPGDLVFFGSPLAPGEAYHVGIYVGNGTMIDAPHTGTTVRKDQVSGFGSIAAIRRLVPTTGNGSVANGNGSGMAGSVQYTYAQLQCVWNQAGGNPQAAPIAAAIAMAESGGNSQATDNDSNGSTDRGLWQINSVHGAQSSYDVMTNARAAVAISNNGTTWSPWVTYQTGAYQQYMQSGVQPDCSAPINATNAAANQGGADAQEVSIFGDAGSALKCVSSPLSCIQDNTAAGGGKVAGTIAGKLVLSIIGMVLNPLIEIVAGIMGITAGAALMVIGLYLTISGTQTGRKAIGTGIGAAGMATGQPELMAAGRGAQGGMFGMMSAAGSQRTQTIRGQEVGARQQATRQAVTEREVYRQQQMGTRDQLRQASYAYRQQQGASSMASRQAATQGAMTQRQSQRHRQTMARAEHRARLADRPRPSRKGS